MCSAVAGAQLVSSPMKAWLALVIQAASRTTTSNPTSKGNRLFISLPTIANATRAVKQKIPSHQR